MSFLFRCSSCAAVICPAPLEVRAHPQPHRIRPRFDMDAYMGACMLSCCPNSPICPIDCGNGGTRVDYVCSCRTGFTGLCCERRESSQSHYSDVIMGTIASQITSLTIVYSTIYLDADQRKHQRSAPLASVRGSHRGPVDSPHKWPVTRKMFPFDDVMMSQSYNVVYWGIWDGCIVGFGRLVYCRLVQMVKIPRRHTLIKTL